MDYGIGFKEQKAKKEGAQAEKFIPSGFCLLLALVVQQSCEASDWHP
jgi:hypothetical protein